MNHIPHLKTAVFCRGDFGSAGWAVTYKLQSCRCKSCLWRFSLQGNCCSRGAGHGDINGNINVHFLIRDDRWFETLVKEAIHIQVEKAHLPLT